MEQILQVNALSFTCPDGDGKRVIFDHTSLAFEEGTFYAVTGDSGSGKTAFLYIIGGLENDYEGTVTCQGKNIRDIGLDAYRRSHVSMIFQNYNLIEYLTPLENLLLAMDISDAAGKPDKKQAQEILASLGMEGTKAERKTSLLSGGEKQRRAIARALASNAKIIIADEPTGNLDAGTALEAADILQSAAHDKGRCVIMVTHNEKLAEMADVRYHINQETHTIDRIQEFQKKGTADSVPFSE